MPTHTSVLVAIEKITKAQTLLEEVRGYSANGKLLTAQERLLDAQAVLAELGLWLATAQGHRTGYEEGRREG